MNRSRTATWVRLMAGTAIVSLALTACGSDSDDEPESAASDTPSASDSAPTAALTNDKCANETSADALRVGGILPLTGSLAYLGPPEISGVGLAISDINAAGGVGDVKACHDIKDSGDANDLSVSTQSAGALVDTKPSVVIGAASSSVTLNVVDTFADNKIVEISPANTAVDLSGYSPWYFRTAPPDGIQGNALGTLISTDGYSKVGFLVFNDTYGTGLRNAVEDTITAAGGSCVYGCKGNGEEFPPGQTTFSAEVNGVLAAKPDAIVVLAFDETKSIIPELASHGWDMAKTYFSDGNTADYTGEFDSGTLEGAQGTYPGADPDQAFKDRLTEWYQSAEGETLKDFVYGAESYDAVTLAALAAVKGGATDPATIQKNLAAVSGATDGEECTSYADCIALLQDDKEIHYKGPSGIGPIDKQNDPSSAFIGIYTYNADNKNELTSTVEGSKQ